MDSHSLHAAARTRRARLIARALVDLKNIVRDWRQTLVAAGPRGRLT
jgi:hypothetical protein